MIEFQIGFQDEKLQISPYIIAKGPYLGNYLSRDENSKIIFGNYNFIILANRKKNHLIPTLFSIFC